MFTHVLPNRYDWPEGVELATNGKQDQFVIDEEYKKTYSDNLKAVIDERRQFYRTSHIMIPMGNDFSFQNATATFTDIELIIDNITMYFGDEVEIIFSTPS